MIEYAGAGAGDTVGYRAAFLLIALLPWLAWLSIRTARTRGFNASVIGGILGGFAVAAAAIRVVMPLFFGSLGAVVGVSALFWTVGIVVGIGSRLAFSLQVPPLMIHPAAAAATGRRKP